MFPGGSVLTSERWVWVLWLGSEDDGGGRSQGNSGLSHCLSSSPASDAIVPLH